MTNLTVVAPVARPTCKCRVCGRTLRNAKSVAAGVGPTCALKGIPMEGVIVGNVGWKMPAKSEIVLLPVSASQKEISKNIFDGKDVKIDRGQATIIFGHSELDLLFHREAV